MSVGQSRSKWSPRFQMIRSFHSSSVKCDCWHCFARCSFASKCRLPRENEEFAARYDKMFKAGLSEISKRISSRSEGGVACSSLPGIDRRGVSGGSTTNHIQHRSLAHRVLSSFQRQNKNADETEVAMFHTLYSLSNRPNR